MERSKPFLFLILILCLYLGKTTYSQSFSEEEQNYIDSLNIIINNPKSHDTSLVSAYLNLSTIWYLSDYKAFKTLNEKAKEIAEEGLKSNPKDEIKQSLLKSLSIALRHLGEVYDLEGDKTRALEFYHKSLEINEELGDKSGIATSLNEIGLNYKHQGDIPKAIEFYTKALIIREEIGDQKAIAQSLTNIGLVYQHQGDIPKALENYHLALKIFEETGGKEGNALALNNIGRIYENQGDMPEALEYYQKSLAIFEEMSAKRGIAMVTINIGYVYKSENNIPKTLEFFHKALKIREEIGDKWGVAHSLQSIGSIYQEQAEQSEGFKRDSLLNNALEYYDKCMNMYEQMGDKEGIAATLIDLGSIELEIGIIKKAQNYVQHSLVIAQEIGLPIGIKNASLLLSKIYERLNKGLQALEMHKLYITMRDSISNEETQKATAQQQAKYEYNKQKVIDDAEHDKLLAIEQEEKEKQQIFTAATASILGLVIMFLYFVFNRLKITRKQKLLIEEQKTKVEKQRDVIKDAHKEITDSIEYAKRIQSAILPPARIVKEYLEDSFILYTPKDVVAGDFYWMRHKDDKILFAAADCTGHGVPGAMVSVVCNMALNRAVREYGLTEPGPLLDKTREIVVREFEKSDEEVKDGMDIALCTLEGNKLQYAGAYNPLWIIRNGELLETKANRWPIGLSQDPQPYTTHSIELEKGDLIYIFTDGFVDQFGGEKGKKLKVQGFKKLLLSMHDKPMEDQRNIINDAFYDWKGDLEQVDDVCLIGVRI